MLRLQKANFNLTLPFSSFWRKTLINQPCKLILNLEAYVQLSRQNYSLAFIILTINIFSLKNKNSLSSFIIDHIT